MTTYTTYADLPDATLNEGKVFLVTDTFGDHHRGYYMSNGTAWVSAVKQGDYIMKRLWDLDLEKAEIVHSHVINDISDATTVGKALMSASSQAAARGAIGAGTGSFSGAYGDLSGIPSTFTPSTHTHVVNDISDATTIGKNIVKASNAAAVRGLIFSAATHIDDSETNAPVDCPTNAPNNAPTNLNVLTTLLGALTGEVNATNARQNTIANNCNAIATKVNTGNTLLNLLASKFNLSLDIHQNNGMMAA